MCNKTIHLIVAVCFNAFPQKQALQCNHKGKEVVNQVFQPPEMINNQSEEAEIIFCLCFTIISKS
jgi:hypothetical protein